MSAYHTYGTDFVDQDCLVQALQDVQCYKAQVHDSPVHLIDYCGRTRPDMAEIVVPRAQINGAANDIGFKRQKNQTFKAIISEYDSCFHNADWMEKLKDSYAERKSIQIGKSQGFAVSQRETTKNAAGKKQTVLHFTRVQAKA